MEIQDWLSIGILMEGLSRLSVKAPDEFSLLWNIDKG